LSHIAEIAVKGVAGESLVRDLDALAAAARSLGGELLRGKRTYKCYPGGWVGDTRPPEWWTPDMWEKCDHAIAFEGCEYEVGVVASGGGHRLVFDFWRAGGLRERLGGDDAPRLMAAYADRRNMALARDALLAEAAAQGYAAEVVDVGPDVAKVVVRL